MGGVLLLGEGSDGGTDHDAHPIEHMRSKLAMLAYDMTINRCHSATARRYGCATSHWLQTGQMDRGDPAPSPTSPTSAAALADTTRTTNSSATGSPCNVRPLGRRVTLSAMASNSSASRRSAAVARRHRAGPDRPTRSFRPGRRGTTPARPVATWPARATPSCPGSSKRETGGVQRASLVSAGPSTAGVGSRRGCWSQCEHRRRRPRGFCVRQSSA